MKTVTKKSVAAAATTTSSSTTTREVRVGEYAKDLILANENAGDTALTSAEIIADVRSKFPNSKFQRTHLYWYVSKLRADNLIA